VLTFGVVLAIILRKGVKSLQNRVSEALSWLGAAKASASAYSQARYQLKHTGFVELNPKAVVETLYGDGDYPRCWGFRGLAVDGSKVALPDSEEVRKGFGTLADSGGKDHEIQGERPWALASVRYDVLNRVALDATRGRGDAYEGDLAVGHLAHPRAGDLHPRHPRSPRRWRTALPVLLRSNQRNTKATTARTGPRQATDHSM